ncbi:MAG: histidine phosphatase family protein [Candidatus Adlerbacteria bacterium]|nr:histidine phosphatase family protein [Candidatus Adlerbacteria bacterium]MDZ4226198.1 histidine phosphatase family protein [Patescibacteria group bacterium]
MKTIYLVRHGESEANISQNHGSPDSPLTERGHQQAKFIAERASKLPVELLISSDFTRARQTAEHISKKIGLEPEISRLFGESKGPSRFFNASYEDQEAITAFAQMRENYGKPGWRFEDGENFEDHHTRAMAALQLLADKKEERILVVTHGMFLRILAAHVIFGAEITAHECQRVVHSLETENTGLTIFNYGSSFYDGRSRENPWLLWVYNDHAHLAD